MPSGRHTASLLNPCPTDAYETVHTVSCLQGIVNRNAPNLWVNYTSSDPQWLEYVQSHGWPANAGAPVTFTSVPQLVANFSSYLSGVVLYDPSKCLLYCCAVMVWRVMAGSVAFQACQQHQTLPRPLRARGTCYLCATAMPQEACTPCW